MAHVRDGMVAPGSGTLSYIGISSVRLPLKTPASDAKVLTGRQRPLTELSLLIVELATTDGQGGIGFSYSLRAGGLGQYSHAREIAPELLGEDPNAIGRIYQKLLWVGASVGRSGLSTQAIAAFDIALWDMKAKRAKLSLARFLGAHRNSVRCYNTSGGYLHEPIEEVLENAEASLARGVGGIKIKVGQPDTALDLKRVTLVRERLDKDVAVMVDANQQWDRITARRMGRDLEHLDLTWIEEPLDAYDTEGHAALSGALDTPIASGEMLTSVLEHWELIKNRAVDFLQPDAPRVGGITPFLRIAALAGQHNLQLAPHFVMELHIHLAATYEHEPWLEHFEWLEPLFNERLEIHNGRVQVPDRPGIGLTLSDRARAWTSERAEFGHIG